MLVTRWDATALRMTNQGELSESRVMRLRCSWWKRTRAQSKSRKGGDQTALKELHGQPQRLGRDLCPIRGILANQRTKLMAEFQSGRTQSGKEPSESNWFLLDRSMEPRLLLFQASKRSPTLWPLGKALRSRSVGTRCSLYGKPPEVGYPAGIGSGVESKTRPVCKGHKRLMLQ